MLNVEEISDRDIHFTKGSVFRLTLPFEEQNNIDICTLATGRKNNFIYRRCLQLGGKWEPILNEWVFSTSVKKNVDAIQGIIDSEKKYIEATFEETISLTNEILTLFGYPLIKTVTASGKVILHNGIKLMSGDLAWSSSGEINKSIILVGSKLRLFIPSLMLDSEYFHEDYLCVVNIKKKCKPKKSTVPTWSNF
ncbi:hypothetical protein [Candidatus Enterovibrio altilux]|nr:hypothetical protein [Candidatus Enterovibrio luxaltus]